LASSAQQEEDSMGGNGTGKAFAASIRTTDVRPEGPTRIERDSLGEVAVPASVYWGVNTARAIDNFAISGRPISDFPDFIATYAQVKQAAARANAEIGSLPRDRADLIDAACEEIRHGALLDQFVVDIMQGGAGTSTNMNVNEVIANRGLELGGHEKGDYEHLSPNDDVNRSQSTNDTYPTALKLALHVQLDRLLAEMTLLEDAFTAKARAFAHVIKVGRTQLQDAVPMTLGQEFGGFATMVHQSRVALEQVRPALRTISLGATAIGTGIAADPRYAEAARRHLSEITGLELETAADLVATTSNMGAFMELSGAINRFAMLLSKICSDLRLLSSGPQAGIGDIRLPERQAGSSIMPGKVNPVICEAVNQVAFSVLGNDLVVSVASESGQLQLNAFGPVIANALLTSEKWLTAALITLRENCVEGITTDERRLSEESASLAGVATAFIPYIGYAAASTIAKHALATGRSVADLIVEGGLMERVDVDAILQPARLSGLDTSVPELSRHYPQDRHERE
jgi:aspartate ammonia-lyase